MQSTEGKTLKTSCPVRNCVTNHWKLQPFFDINEESNKQAIKPPNDNSEESNTSYIVARIYAFDKRVKSF
jgi:hypothetical protein